MQVKEIIEFLNNLSDEDKECIAFCELNTKSTRVGYPIVDLFVCKYDDSVSINSMVIFSYEN